MAHVRTFVTTTILCVLVMGAPPASAGATFSKVFAFGDSITDSGNFFLASGGQPPAPYAQRFSNGPVWIEQLAGLVGAAPLAPSLAGGSDFAFGFSRASNMGLGPPNFGVPSLDQQVGSFLLTSHTPANSELYALWAGANDLFDGQSDPSIPADAVANQVKALHDAGARNLLVMNLPPIQDTPDFRALSPEVRTGAATWVNAFNTLLAINLANLPLSPETTLCQFDTSSFFNEMVTNPALFGLANVTERAFVTSPAPSVAPNAHQYLFWDGVHPTTTAHGLLAMRVYTCVPEPSTAVVAVGAALALFARRRRPA